MDFLFTDGRQYLFLQGQGDGRFALTLALSRPETKQEPVLVDRDDFKEVMNAMNAYTRQHSKRNPSAFAGMTLTACCMRVQARYVNGDPVNLSPGA